MSCFVPGSGITSPSGIQQYVIPSVAQSPQNIDPSKVKLSHYASGLGCACKLKPQALETILRGLPPSTVKDENLLVGIETNDDAAIYQINPDQALVLTTDFFPPIVDDPEMFGKIAAANAMSDVYAKGGRPVSALSLVGFPSQKLPLEVLARILKGATEKANEAGIIISGGHTIDDPEPKFGLAVTGIVHPQRFFRNVGARPGDVLILTKGIGTGIVTTCMKKGVAPPSTAEHAMASMSMLNRGAQETICRPNFQPLIHAVTDVTGFGLAGHLRSMLLGSNVSARLDFAAVPQIPGALELLRLRGSAAFSQGSANNMAHVADVVLYSDRLGTTERQLVCDAQTSGGLLIAIDGSNPTTVTELVSALRAAGCPLAAAIGTFLPVSTEGPQLFVGVGDPAAQAQQVFQRYVPPPPPPVEAHPIDPTLVWMFKNAILTLGNEKLGAILAAGMLSKLLTTNAPLPRQILFLGDAIELTTINDNTVATLRELERRGVVVWSCSTCLNHLKLTEGLRVGRAVSADEVVELLATAPRVVSMS